MIANQPGVPPPDVELVTDLLRAVIDPELGCNIVDLGLIYDIAVDDDGVACITMTTTTPGCPAVSYLKDGVERAALAVPGIAGVEVAVTYEPPWTPDMMSGPTGQLRPVAKPRLWRPW